MIRNSLFQLLIILSALMICGACQQGADTSNESASKATQKQTKKADPVSFLPEAPAITDLDMKKIMADVIKIELLFYLGDNTMSTDVESPDRIRYFALYIAPEAANTVPSTCKPNGSALFINSNGDIAIDAEFNNSKECSYIRMKANGQEYRHQLTEAGRAYFQSFVDMGNNKAETMKN